MEREINPSVAHLYLDAEKDDFQIVRTKRFAIKPMTPEEAILQMNLLDHEFFAFKNQEENDAFTARHSRATPVSVDPDTYSGKA